MSLTVRGVGEGATCSVGRASGAHIEYLEEGGSRDLAGSYCLRVIPGALPSAIGDSRRNAVTAGLEVTESVGIGSDMGVPLGINKGEPWGMLCCVSRGSSPRLLGADTREFEVAADLVEELLSGEADFALRRRR